MMLAIVSTFFSLHALIKSCPTVSWKPVSPATATAHTRTAATTDNMSGKGRPCPRFQVATCACVASAGERVKCHGCHLCTKSVHGVPASWAVVRTFSMVHASQDNQTRASIHSPDNSKMGESQT